MSDSEDFIFHIDAEEFLPTKEACSPKSKRIKLSRKKKKQKKMKLPKIKKLFPNHFIGFQIFDSIIHENIIRVQNKIVERNPLLKKALIDVRTLHITLAVTHLENKEKIKALQEKLDYWSENDLKSHFVQPIHLTFKGIGIFRKEVAFVKINECNNYKRLCNLADAMNELLCKSGFYAENNRKFKPHLTLLKLSKNYKLFKDKKCFIQDFQVLNECEDDFGTQDIKDIQLLSMNSEKDENGYYKCLWHRKTEEFSENVQCNVDSNKCES